MGVPTVESTVEEWQSLVAMREQMDACRAQLLQFQVPAPGAAGVHAEGVAPPSRPFHLRYGVIWTESEHPES